MPKEQGMRVRDLLSAASGNQECLALSIIRCAELCTKWEETHQMLFLFV